MKIVIITNGNFFARVELTRLFHERHKEIAGVIVITGVKVNKSRVRSLVEIFIMSGWRYFTYKLCTYLAFVFGRLVYPKGIFFVPGLAKKYFIPVVFSAQVNAPEVINRVKLWRPEILISVSCPHKIGKEMLAIPSKCVINIHASLLPKYAGIAPYVWVLANREKVTGTTVHIMDEAFDTGAIILQKQIPIRDKETSFSLFLRLCLLGSDVLAESVTKLVKGVAKMTPQDLSNYTYFSWPKVDTIRMLYSGKNRLFTLYELRKAFRYAK